MAGNLNAVVDIMESVDVSILTFKHFTMCSKPFARSRARHVVLEHALDYLLVKKSPGHDIDKICERLCLVGMGIL